jgi:hypothetical protein
VELIFPSFPKIITHTATDCREVQNKELLPYILHKNKKNATSKSA